MEYIYDTNKITVYSPTRTVLAEVTFPALDAATVNINHTFVDESLRGQGVASALMFRAASELRRQKKKALISCTYAKKWFDQNPEFKDVLLLQTSQN